MGKSPNKKTPDDEHNKYIHQQLQRVKNGAELCMTRYMSKRQAMDTLSRVKNIKPDLTELVWERLEKDNPEFFKAYYTKLILKDQIKEFNRLLSKQAEFIISSPDGGTSHALSNSPQQQCVSNVITAQSDRPVVRDGMQQINMFDNYGSPIQSSGTVQETLNEYARNRAIDASRNLFLSQVMNGKHSQASLSENLNAGFISNGNHTQASLSENPNVIFGQGMNGNHEQAAGGLSLCFSMDDAASFLAPFTSTIDSSLDDIPPGWNSCFLEQFQPSPDSEFAADSATNSELLGSYHMPPPLSLIRDTNSVVVPNGHVGILDPASESLCYPFLGDQIE